MSETYALSREGATMTPSLTQDQMMDEVVALMKAYGGDALLRYTITSSGGERWTASQWWGLMKPAAATVSEPVEDNGYSVWRVDPVTGRRLIQVAQDLTAVEVMAFLNPPVVGTTAFQCQYQVVQQFDQKSFLASEFLSRAASNNAVDAVLSAWAKADVPQMLMIQQQWPTLAAALDNLAAEASGA